MHSISGFLKNVIFLSLLPSPCALAGPPAPPPAIEVALQVDAIVGPGQRRALLPGEMLRSGDSFVLTVTASRKAHVYVAHVSSKGETSVLYPAEGKADVVVAPDEEVVLPGGDRSFRLDERAGTENLLVIAAEQSLTGEEQKKYLRLAIREPPPPPPPPPPPIDSPARPGELKASSRPKAVQAKAGRTGVALLRFLIRHERRQP